MFVNVSWPVNVRRVVVRKTDIGEETILTAESGDFCPSPECCNGPAYVRENDGSYTAYYRAPQKAQKKPPENFVVFSIGDWDDGMTLEARKAEHEKERAEYEASEISDQWIFEDQDEAFEGDFFAAKSARMCDDPGDLGKSFGRRCDLHNF